VLFDQYSVYRPEMIETWLRGGETQDAAARWQAELWRATMTDGRACQGKFLDDLIRALRNPECDRTRLPERLSVFAASSLPPVYLKVFQTPAQLIPVHFFWLSPSRDYRRHLTSVRQDERMPPGTGARNPDPGPAPAGAR